MALKFDFLKKLVSPETAEKVVEAAKDAAKTVEAQAALDGLVKKEADTAVAQPAPEAKPEAEKTEGAETVTEVSEEDVLALIAEMAEDIEALKAGKETKEVEVVKELSTAVNANFEAVAKEAADLKERLAASEAKSKELEAQIVALKEVVSALGADTTKAAKKEIIRSYRASQDEKTINKEAGPEKVGGESQEDFFGGFLGLK